MRLYAEDGDRPAAMKQYHELQKLLEKELGMTILLEEFEIETFRSIRSLAAFLEPRVPKTKLG